MTRTEFNVATGYNFTEEQALALLTSLDDSGVTLADIAPIVKATVGIVKDSSEPSVDTAYYLIRLSVENQSKDLARAAINLIGMRKFIAYKLRTNLKLFPSEVEYISNCLVETGVNDELANLIDRQE